ncbi:MAG: Uma2 family endonuclease [Chloroflexi bacterium]|nr:Uma2 family endonuclease [Chloroflexota bacterium]
MAISERRLTLEQFLKLPEEEPPLELDSGMVTQKVSPKGQHSALQDEVLEAINRFARPRRLARAFPELRTTFGGQSCVPDVAVYRWNRIPVDRAGRIANDFLEPPDIAVEIVSPEQSTNAVVRRCLWYVANGVPVALLVDPVDESILVFRPEQPPKALRDSDQIDLTDVLPGFALTVGELFASLQVR